MIENQQSMAERVDTILANRQLYHVSLQHGGTSPAIISYAMMGQFEFMLKFHNHAALTEVLNTKDHAGNQILHYAAGLGNLELVQYIVEHSGLIDFRNHDSSTPLFFAVVNDHKEVVECLLKAGADPDSASYDGSVFRHTKNEEMKQVLREHGGIEPVDFDDKYMAMIDNLLLASKPLHLHDVQESCMAQPTIPHNVHYVWLTNPNRPQEAPQSHLQYVTDSMATLRNGTNYNYWHYKFHTNAPHALTNTTNFFESLGFEINDITSQYRHFHSGSFIDTFVEHKKYGLAADLARYEIVNQQGGMYLDLNFNLTRAVDHEFCAYSYANFAKKSHDLPLVENYFFIARPGHPILEQTIHDIYTPFFGSGSKLYWQNLNATNRELTDSLFFLFAINNIMNFANNAEPAILYDFLEHDSYSSVYNDYCAMEKSEVKRVLNEKYEQLVQRKILQSACTDINSIPPIGYDGLDGQSWMAGEGGGDE